MVIADGMTPTHKTYYSTEEFLLRYHTWAELPAITPEQINRRQSAWHTYCDARDGLPEGTSACRATLHTAVLPERQMGLFS